MLKSISFGSAARPFIERARTIALELATVQHIRAPAAESAEMTCCPQPSRLAKDSPQKLSGVQTKTQLRSLPKPVLGSTCFARLLSLETHPKCHRMAERSNLDAPHEGKQVGTVTPLAEHLAHSVEQGWTGWGDLLEI